MNFKFNLGMQNRLGLRISALQPSKTKASKRCFSICLRKWWLSPKTKPKTHRALQTAFTIRLVASRWWMTANCPGKSQAVAQGHPESLKGYQIPMQSSRTSLSWHLFFNLLTDTWRPCCLLWFETIQKMMN